MLRDKTKTDLLDQAVDALMQTTGLNIEVKHFKRRNYFDKGNSFIQVTINQKIYSFVVKIRNIDRFATITQIKHQFEEFEESPLLIALKLTDAAADKCRELGLNFIDLSGNAYVNEPGLFIFIKGQKGDPHKNTHIHFFKNTKALTPTNLRAVFVLLCNPDMLNASYREIAKVAGIALGAVGWIFNDLTARAITLGDSKNKNRVFIQQEKLILEWVTNYPIKLRPKLNPRRFKVNNLDWWQKLDVNKYKALWGGEVAANKLTQYLKPNFYTLYLYGEELKKNMNKLIIENKLVPDPNGNVEILETFWNLEGTYSLSETVPALLVYADLIASNDPRNLEVSKMIYGRLVKHASN